jgi:hypothetical protein
MDPLPEMFSYPLRIDDVKDLSEKRWNELRSHHLSAVDWDPQLCPHGF